MLMLRRTIVFALLLQSFLVKATNSFQLPRNQRSNIVTGAPGIFGKLYGDLQFGAANIYWRTYEHSGNSQFFVERSGNGKDYEVLGNVSSADGFNFTYRDSMALPTGFYRIKVIASDTAYSDVLRLSSISGLPQINVTPVVFDALITVEIDSKISEEFNISLFNGKGEQISSRLLYAEKGKNKIVFDDAISFLYKDEYTMSITGVQYSYTQTLYKK